MLVYRRVQRRLHSFAVGAFSAIRDENPTHFTKQYNAIRCDRLFRCSLADFMAFLNMLFSILTSFLLVLRFSCKYPIGPYFGGVACSKPSFCSCSSSTIYIPLNTVACLTTRWLNHLVHLVKLEFIFGISGKYCEIPDSVVVEGRSFGTWPHGPGISADSEKDRRQKPSDPFIEEATSQWYWTNFSSTFMGAELGVWCSK